MPSIGVEGEFQPNPEITPETLYQNLEDQLRLSLNQKFRELQTASLRAESDEAMSLALEYLHFARWSAYCCIKNAFDFEEMYDSLENGTAQLNSLVDSKVLEIVIEEAVQNDPNLQDENKFETLRKSRGLSEQKIYELAAELVLFFLQEVQRLFTETKSPAQDSIDLNSFKTIMREVAFTFRD